MGKFVCVCYCSTGEARVNRVSLTRFSIDWVESGGNSRVRPHFRGKKKRPHVQRRILMVCTRLGGLHMYAPAFSGGGG